jgi:acetyl esterase/lipase
MRRLTRTLSRALARSRPGARDVVFTPEGSPVPLRLDVYLPRGQGPFPAVLAIHGGGWHKGDRSWMRGVCADLARAGFAAVAPDYRAGRQHGRWPNQVTDLSLALDWTRQHGSGLSVDTDRIAVMGTSAGGHLAAVMATDPTNGLSAIATWSAPVDLSALAEETANPNWPEFAAGLEAQFGPDRPWSEDLLAAASPVLRIGPRTPPWFMAHSLEEFVPLSQARRLGAALESAVVPHAKLLVPGSAHGTQLRGAAMRPTIEFLLTHLDRS